MKPVIAVPGFITMIAMAGCSSSVTVSGFELTRPAHTALPNSGTGVFIDQDGDLLTAAHVVAHCREIEIGSDLVSVREASLIDHDQDADVALLKSPGPVPMAAPIGAGLMEPPLMAFGYSAGSLRQRSEMTLPTSLNARLKSDAPDAARRLMWLDDRAISHGWSGGPVIDGRGDVVGIIRSVVRTSAEMSVIMNITTPAQLSGVATAEPVDALRGLLPDAAQPAKQIDNLWAQPAVVRVFCWPPA